MILNKNQILVNFLNSFFEAIPSEVKLLFEKYYGNNLTYDEIATYFGCSRQAIENRMSRYKKNLSKMLLGKTYKKISASNEVIIIKNELIELFKGLFVMNDRLLKEKMALDFKANKVEFSLFLSSININMYNYEDENLFTITKHKITFVQKIISNLIKILNNEIFGITEFDLIVKLKKILKNKKIFNSEIISLCNALPFIYFENELYFLSPYKLTSYDKKAIYILRRNKKEMTSREIANEVFKITNESFNENNHKAIVNSMTNSDHIQNIGKTGRWVLKDWDYETKFHLESIVDVFREAKHELTSQEIYDKIKVKRKDLSVTKIQSYLYVRNEIFSRTGKDLFVLNSWKKLYLKKINSYNKLNSEKDKFINYTRELFASKEEMAFDELANGLIKKGIKIKKESIRGRLNRIKDIRLTKKGKRSYYSLKTENSEIKDEFLNNILRLFREAKNGVENRKADVLLKNGNEPKTESEIQTALYEMLRGYMISENIDVSREAWTGRGPVDFKFSKGRDLIVLLEVKLGSSSKIMEGLEAQLVQYQGSESIKYGIFVVFIFNDEELKKITIIENQLKEIKDKYRIVIKFEFIDARGKKPSPSNLKIGEETILDDLI